MCKTYHNNKQYYRNHGKDDRSSTDNGADLLRSFFSKITCDQNCDTHSKLDHYKGNKIQYLTSGGNR